LTILVSIPALRIVPTRRQLLGVIGGLVCIGVVFREGNLRLDVPLADLAMAATVPLAYCLSNIVLKLRCADIGTLPLAFANLTLAAAILVPIGWTVEGVIPAANSVPETSTVSDIDTPEENISTSGSTRGPFANPTALVSILCVVWLGIVGTGAANFMFYKLIQEHGPLFASMVTYFIPTIALFWGWLDNEHITPLQIVGLLGTFIMIALVQTSRPGLTVNAAEERA
jgi:drug/metabolite transporter (DMT)-like permease